MHGTAALLLVNLFVLTSAHEINYCGSKMCGYSNAHTFCQYTSSPSASCTGYISALLTAEEERRVLARLNRRRDDTASGRLRGLPSAANMLKLRWVEELAREAQIWADQCEPPKTPEEHDACRDLYSTSVGQCVASVVGEAPGLRVESMVDIWFMQNMLYKGNVTLYEPPDSRRYYGDFAQIMWSRSFMVGCGRSRFMVLLRGRFRTVERLVCNFAPKGPPAHQPLWSPGVPATACPARSRPYTVLPSLCNYQNELNQPNDIDNSMTIEEHILLNTVLEMEGNQSQYRAIDEIYLTYLAIVTMQSYDTTTSHYNSMQKRDIIEKNSIEFEIDKVKELGPVLNVTTESQTIAKSYKKNIKIVGRHKAYKMDELSDSGVAPKGKNHALPETILNRKKDFYYDYNMDVFDDNTTTQTSEQIKFEKDLNENATLEDHTNENTPSANITIKSLLDQIQLDTVKNKEIIVDNDKTYLNNITSANESIAATERTVEDYLSDPETARQMQEALDHMEREANNASRSSGKIHRRDIPSEAEALEEPLDEETQMALAKNNITFISDNKFTVTLTPEEERNKTLESGPIRSMMLKYMPYLKTYENEILGTNNLARSVCPSFVLIVIVLSLSL